MRLSRLHDSISQRPCNLNLVESRCRNQVPFVLIHAGQAGSCDILATKQLSKVRVTGLRIVRLPCPHKVLVCSQPVTLRECGSPCVKLRFARQLPRLR
jgi:hypothetical protein